jgi:hypothetical protein
LEEVRAKQTTAGGAGPFPPPSSEIFPRPRHVQAVRPVNRCDAGSKRPISVPASTSISDLRHTSLARAPSRPCALRDLPTPVPSPAASARRKRASPSSPETARSWLRAAMVLRDAKTSFLAAALDGVNRGKGGLPRVPAGREGVSGRAPRAARMAPSLVLFVHKTDARPGAGWTTGRENMMSSLRFSMARRPRSWLCHELLASTTRVVDLTKLHQVLTSPIRFIEDVCPAAASMAPFPKLQSFPAPQLSPRFPGRARARAIIS